MWALPSSLSVPMMGMKVGGVEKKKDVCVNVCRCFFVEIMQTESQGCGSDCEASALNSDLSTFAQAHR